ncbi:glycosyltransferase [Devosia sp.]|uniref:glycosyltransferase n=1 Tax=Devosia sp. TaxID=1871048 RepID=UPI002FC9DBD5
MRILLVHKLYELTGGAEVFFRETERVLRESGHETLMVATGDPQSEHPGNVVLMQAPAYDRGGMLSRLVNLPAAIYDLGKKRQMAEIIAGFKPDIMHVFAINVHLSPSVVQAAHDASVPVVGTFNDYKHICPNYKLFHHGRICFDCKGRKFYRAPLNKCAKDSRALSVASAVEAYVHDWLGVYDKFDHFTFSSDFMARTTAEFWPDRPFSWSKLRNPFDSAAQRPLDVYEPFGLYFGRLIDEKGVDRVIEAARDVDGFPIKIIGNGPDFEHLQAMVERYGLTNVEFLGPKWGDELNAILARARFVIVPSVWHENFPYVINQAFALGRPVIGSRRGGITELVAEGERGLVFEPGNPGELASHIRRLAADEGAARRMGAAAKRYSDANFNDDTFLAEVNSAYEQGLDAHSRRRR